MKKIIQWIQKEIVLIVVAFLAVVSMFFVPPDVSYLDYIDMRVLAILYGLMLIVAGIRRSGAFDRLIHALTKKLRSVTAVELVLVLICFFASMLITNDVALVTFVPFALATLKLMDREEDGIFVVVMQTIAANLGSMVTPIGNPQNLYVYTAYELSLGELAGLMAPYAAVSLALLLGGMLLWGRLRRRGNGEACEEGKSGKMPRVKVGRVTRKDIFPVWKKILLGLLFAVALSAVLRVLDYRIMLALIVVGIAVIDPKLFAGADYVLLVTFVAFFILVGNLKMIPEISEWLQRAVVGREFYVTLLTSQVISNVPATMLLSGFTSEAKELLLGADLGGLGTIIASMASLISLRQYSTTAGAKKGRYLAVFTLLNVGFLAVLLGLHALIG